MIRPGTNATPTTPGALPSPARPVEEMKAKVVLAGAPGVGKTSLVQRYVLGQFSENYLRTLGAVVYKRKVNVGVWTGRIVRVTMTLWDTMGEQRSDAPFHNVDMFGAQGILGVCDVTDANSVPPLRGRLVAALQASGDVPVHLLMNKSDLEPDDDARAAAIGAGLDRGAPCYLTSAKAGDNVVAAFEDLARRIVERSLLPPATFDGVDGRIVAACASSPRSLEAVSRQERIPVLFAEARLERLRRNGLLTYATLALDDAGRPHLSYGATGKSLPNAAVPVVQ